VDEIRRKLYPVLKAAKWKRNLDYFKVALNGNKNQNKHGGFTRAHKFCHINTKLDESEMASVLSSNKHNNDSQSTEVYKTPSQRPHNICNASGRFQKVEAIHTRKETKINMLHKGFKKWNVKRKLQYDIISKKNEPPAKKMTRALEVSTFFFILNFW